MIKFHKNNENSTIPTTGSDGAAGYDLYAAEELSIPSGIRMLVDVGVTLEMPPGVVGLIWPRSGLACSGIDVGAGVIDSDYRGGVKALLINSSGQEKKILIGDRIAQIIFQPCLNCAAEGTTRLSETDRGNDGFGSTGK